MSSRHLQCNLHVFTSSGVPNLIPLASENIAVTKNQLTVRLFEADGRLEPLHRDELSSDEAEVERDLIDFRVRDPNPGIFFDEDIFLQQRIARRSRQVQRRPLDGVEADRLLANV